MTVPYNSYIHTVTFAGFFNLLLKWNGSVYKLLWRTMLIYVCIYTLIALLYHFLLTRTLKIQFEKAFDYCNAFQEYIPVSFVLGFYVSNVVKRWWSQFNSLPHPTSFALYVTTHIRGTTDRCRLIRRTIMRYACLGFVLSMVTISGPVKKRFPSYKHMVQAGFLLKSEQTFLENLVTQYNIYYVPFVWASTLLAQARKDDTIADDHAFHCLLQELNKLRTMCQSLINYDWVNIPLVYTQVATLAVYIFFTSCLIGRQHIPVYTLTGKPTNQGEMIVPVFTLLQFLFYMGWLKVAEELINPFGEDDDDFDINPLIDKNFKMSYLIVDEMHGECPTLVKDRFWNQLDIRLPYTPASMPSYRFPGEQIDNLADMSRGMRYASESEKASKRAFEPMSQLKPISPSGVFPKIKKSFFPKDPDTETKAANEKIVMKLNFSDSSTQEDKNPSETKKPDADVQKKAKETQQAPPKGKNSAPGLTKKEEKTTKEVKKDFNKSNVVQTVSNASMKLADDMESEDDILLDARVAQSQSSLSLTGEFQSKNEKEQEGKAGKKKNKNDQKKKDDNSEKHNSATNLAAIDKPESGSKKKNNKNSLFKSSKKSDKK